ncbi:hypothetical protein J3A69_001144 [Pseudomonas putida]|nr:hypothetical protein [Pseudomonas sp. PvP089]MBP2092300.1 hypothetical protein [Pseudomonas sp. PvP088]MBP2221537.1 hypothetical protein [Pseudomonas putida]
MFLLVEKSAPVLITSKATATQLWYADPCPGPFTDVPQRMGPDDCTQINICNVYRFSPFSDRSVKLFQGRRQAMRRVCFSPFGAKPTEATSLVVFGGGAREGERRWGYGLRGMVGGGVRFDGYGGADSERRPRGASRRKAAPTFVSGQSLLCQGRATALLVRRDIESCAKALARKRHRNNWPETNVGATVLLNF